MYSDRVLRFGKEAVVLTPLKRSTWVPLRQPLANGATGGLIEPQSCNRHIDPSRLVMSAKGCVNLFPWSAELP